MKVTPVRTAKVTAGAKTIAEILDESLKLKSLSEKSILVVSSKIVALAENNVLELDAIDREELIVREADYYLPKTYSKYGHHFTITDNTIIASAGIDESNGDGHFVLWPHDSQTSANQIRQYLADRFKLQYVGVLIVDSTCQPMRRGTTGIALAHSGFLALHDYRGESDLFGREIHFGMANVSGGLAAAAVLTMGEGAEQTPLCIVEDVSFVEFQPRDPSAEELSAAAITFDDDLFAPLLQQVPWQRGSRHSPDIS